jgi:protein-disulfide isomerase
VAKKTQTPKKNPETTKTPWTVIIGIGLIAVLVVVVLIQVGRPSPIDVVSLQDLYPPGIEKGINGSGLPFMGDPDAPVKMKLYEDYGCPNCKNFYLGVEEDLVNEFVSAGMVVLTIHPLAFVNVQSGPAAEAIQCAQEQDGFWEYRHLLFINQGVTSFTRDNLITFAEAAGLDQAQFSSCYDQGKYAPLVLEKTLQAQAEGISGTPAMLIGGNLYEGLRPFDSTNPDTPGIKQLIEGEL